MISARTPVQLISQLAIAFLVVTYFSVGCTTLGTVRDQNRTNLIKLTVGMERVQVLRVMGVESFTTHPVRYPYAVIFPPVCILYSTGMGTMTNPYRSETPRTADGTSIEILYYYTDEKSADGAITDDELTPIVLENGVVAGWGWSFLHQNVERYDMEIRIR